MFTGIWEKGRIWEKQRQTLWERKFSALPAQSHVDPWTGSGNVVELPEPIHPFPILPPPPSATDTSQLINSPALIVRVFVLLQSRHAESSKPPLLSCSLTLILSSSQGRDPPLLPGDVRQHLAGAGISAQPKALHIWARFVPSPRDTPAGSAGQGRGSRIHKGNSGTAARPGFGEQLLGAGTGIPGNSL